MCSWYTSWIWWWWDSNANQGHLPSPSGARGRNAKIIFISSWEMYGPNDPRAHRWHQVSLSPAPSLSHLSSLSLILPHPTFSLSLFNRQPSSVQPEKILPSSRAPGSPRWAVPDEGMENPSPPVVAAKDMELSVFYVYSGLHPALQDGNCNSSDVDHMFIPTIRGHGGRLEINSTTSTKKSAQRKTGH